MTSPPHRLATSEDLLAMPGDPRAEIVAGVVVEKASPSAEHSLAQGQLTALLTRHFHRRDGGGDLGGWWILPDVEVEMETHEIYRPDLVGWRRDRVPDRPRGRPVRTRPDWVCEVLSPSNARRPRHQVPRPPPLRRPALLDRRPRAGGPRRVPLG